MNKKEIASSVSEVDIQQAKDRWKKQMIERRGHVINASFEEMVACFKEKLSFVEISSKFGVSPAVIKSIYRDYFMDIFGGKTCKDIQNSRNKNKRKLKEREFFSREFCSSIVSAALLAGCKVDSFWFGPNDSRISYRQIVINESLCLIRLSSECFTQKQGKGVSYFRFQFRMIQNVKPSFVLFCCELKNFPKRIFIVPYEVLEEIFLKSKKTTNKISLYIYIPIVRVVNRRGRPPSVDWWQYENAWHLIV